MTELNRLRANPAYESITAVQVGDIANLQNDGALVISLPNGDSMTVYPYKVENPSLNDTLKDIEWYGMSYELWYDSLGEKHYDPQGSAILLMKEGEIFGTIQSKAHADTVQTCDKYELISLGDGKNAIIKNRYNANEIEDVNPSTPPAETITQHIYGNCNVIRVGVMYTTAAKEAVANIDYTILQAMSQLNTALANSTGNTGKIFVLAWQQELLTSQFDENQSSYSSSMHNALNAALGITTIQNFRDTKAADLIVILTDGNFTDFTGKSAYIGPNNAGAYCMVEADQAIANFTFAHEIGHLMGGRHQQSWITNWYGQDNTAGEAHGYRLFRGGKFLPNGKTDFIDIMHVNTGVGDRQLVYSTPNVQYDKGAIGKLNENDVTHTIEYNFCTVANFRFNAGTSALTATISAPRFVNYGTHFTATIAGINGVPGYTFIWRYSTDGFSWPSLGTGTSVILTMPNHNQVFLRVLAIDASGDQYVATKTVYNSLSTVYAPVSSGSQAFPFRLQSPAGERKLLLYPNPANNDFYFETKVPVSEITGKEKLEITDVLGRVVAIQTVKMNEKMLIHSESIPSGTYQVKITGSTIKDVEKLVIIKK